MFFFCSVYSLLHYLSHTSSSSSSYPIFPHSSSAVTEKLCDPLKKVTGLKWNQHGKKKTKKEKSAGGSTRGLCCQLDTTQMERGWVRDIDGERKRAREWEENSKRMIVEILQDCRRKGKECAEEVRRRVTRCYGGRTSEWETGRR